MKHATMANPIMYNLDHDDSVRQLHDINMTYPTNPYTPHPYKPTESIIRTHLLPRFGFPKNIGVLWEGNGNDNDDQIETYIIGICVGSMFIVGVIAVALMIMAVLRFVGYERVGFWCGHFEYNVLDADNAHVVDEVVGSDIDREDDTSDHFENDAADGDCIENNNDDNNISTGIRVVRTIGTGGFVDRSSHVSIVIEEADHGGNNESAPPLNYKTSRIKEEDEENDCGHQDISIATMQPKPKLKRFRLKVARIDPDGTIIALRPKPVPKELWLKVTIVRISFIFFGIGAIVSAGLFYGLGVKKFRQALVNTRSGISGFNALASKSINVTNNLLDVQQQVEYRLNSTEKAIDVITRSCDLQSFGNTTKLVEYYEIAKDQFDTFSDATKKLLNGFSDNMRNMIEATTIVHDQTLMANIVFAVMVLIMCIMIILIFIMIIGVAFAAYDIENCVTRFMRRVILLPIFVLQVVLATLFSAIFFICALAGSDFCITPNVHAMRMFARVAAGADESLSPLFALALFYLSGCREIDHTRARAIEDVIDGADSVLLVAHDLFNIFNVLTPQDVLTYCNVNQELIGHFDELGVTMHNVTHQLHDSLDATLAIVSCRSVHPVYSNLVHDAVCIDSVSGIEAIFSTLLSIAVLSCCMLALRAALYPIQQSITCDSG